MCVYIHVNLQYIIGKDSFWKPYCLTCMKKNGIIFVLNEIKIFVSFYISYWFGL